MTTEDLGKASRAKKERRKARATAEFEVFCPGVLEVLSIGKGDLKLTLDGKNPEDVDRARKLIEEMLAKGYSIFVEGDDGPVRVKRFNPKRMTYIISELVEEEAPAEAQCPSCHKRLAAPKYDLSSGAWPRHRVSRGNSAFCPQEGQPLDAPAVPRDERTRKRERHVPVAGSRATAVGRTAGG